MAHAFERSLFSVYERFLYTFAEVTPIGADAPFAARAFDGRLCCKRGRSVMAALTLFSLALLIVVHNAHVNTAGCAGAVLGSAARAWAGANESGEAADFFRADDVFRIFVSGDTPRAVLWAGSWNETVGNSSTVRAWEAGAGGSVTPPTTPMSADSLDYVWSASFPLVFLEMNGGDSGKLSSTPVARATPLTATHAFRRIDLVLPLDCSSVGGGGGLTSWIFALGFAAVDTRIINEVMWSFPSRGGWMRSASTGEGACREGGSSAWHS